jgi:hypothetical protein
MNDGQRGLLMELIRTYTSVMSFEVASLRMARLRSGGLDRIAFAWAGTDRETVRYYRVQGPTFLIEYANPQGNHSHAVWLDFERQK